MKTKNKQPKRLLLIATFSLAAGGATGLALSQNYTTTNLFYNAAKPLLNLPEVPFDCSKDIKKKVYSLEHKNSLEFYLSCEKARYVYQTRKLDEKLKKAFHF